MRRSLLGLWSRFSIAVGVVLLVGSLQAQGPSPSEVPPPTIRVSTHMVLVDVVVTDKQGKPVPGLRPEDFVVEENGKAQKIATFTKPEENTAAPPALPPGIYSNRPQYRSAGGPITVMLLDAINTPFKDQAYARFQMLKFVKENLKPNQRMAVLTLTGTLQVLQDFTSDPQVLYTALQHFKPLENQFTPSSGTPPGGARPRAARAPHGAVVGHLHVVRALLDRARARRRLPDDAPRAGPVGGRARRRLPHRVHRLAEPPLRRLRGVPRARGDRRASQRDRTSATRAIRTSARPTRTRPRACSPSCARVPAGTPYFAVLHLSNTHWPYRVDPALQPFEPHDASPYRARRSS